MRMVGRFAAEQQRPPRECRGRAGDGEGTCVPSAETPLTITYRVTSPLAARALTLRCAVVDYWFRPSVLQQTLALKADETREVAVVSAPARRVIPAAAGSRRRAR